MRTHRHIPRGFTVIELLVAAVITVGLSAVLISVISSSLQIYSRTQNALTTNVQSKLIFDLLERDIQAAVYREAEETLLAADIINSSAQLGNHGWRTDNGVMKPSTQESLRPLGDNISATDGIRSARFGVSGVWLRFVTTNVESNGSLPIVVAYQIARRPIAGDITGTNQAAIRYTLFRSAVSAEKTFEQGYSVTAAGYGSSDPLPSYNARIPSTITNPSNFDALADNVVDFGIWMYRSSDSGMLDLIYPTSGGVTHRALGQFGTVGFNRYPDVIDVMVRILREDAAAQLENMEKGLIIRPSEYANDAKWWWAIVEANSDVFVRRFRVGKDMP